MTAGKRHISSFAFRLILHALHPSFSPPYVPRQIYYRLSAARLYLWRSRGFIWTIKATAVRANLPTCKGLIHIDLQMNPDQKRLDKTCSPNAPHHPCFLLHIQFWSWRWRQAWVSYGCVLSPPTRGTAGENNAVSSSVRKHKKQSSEELRDKIICSTSTQTQTGVRGQWGRSTGSCISSRSSNSGLDCKSSHFSRRGSVPVLSSSANCNLCICSNGLGSTNPSV